MSEEEEERMISRKRIERDPLGSNTSLIEIVREKFCEQVQVNI
jgi:hypothetical protein